MRHFHPVASIAQMLADGIRNEYRPMPTARTANRKSDVRLALFFILRKQEVDERIHVLQKIPRLVVRIHVVDNRLIGPGVRLQVGNEIRVRQKADIENQIRVDRNAVFESKTHERHEQMLRLPLLKQPDGMLPQFVNREAGCIQNVIGHRTDWGKQIAFERGVRERTVKAHMTAIFEKLNVRNRTQAGVMLRAMELADPDRREP